MMRILPALDNSVLESYAAADLAAVATGVLELAIRVVPCGFAGLTAARVDGALVVASDPVVEEADRLQREYGEGPRWLPAGVDAVVCVVDTAADVRWPRWGQSVDALALRSMLVVELSARSAGLGALVLYSSEPGWFGTAEQQLAVAVARHASVAIAARREESRLRQAMGSHSLVGKPSGRWWNVSRTLFARTGDLQTNAAVHDGLRLCRQRQFEYPCGGSPR